MGQRAEDCVSKTSNEGSAQTRRVRLGELTIFDATGMVANYINVSLARERTDAVAATGFTEMAAREVSAKKPDPLAPGGAPGAVVSDTNIDALGLGQALERFHIPQKTSVRILDNTGDAQPPAEVEETGGNNAQTISYVDDALV